MQWCWCLSVIWTLSAALVTAVYFCQNTSHPILAAACLLLTDVVAMLAPLAGAQSAEEAMMWGLAVGTVAAVAALVLMLRNRSAEIRLASPVRSDAGLVKVG